MALRPPDARATGCALAAHCQQWQLGARQRFVFAPGASAWESPLGRSVRPLPRRHRHRNLLHSPNGFEGAFSKCSRARGWREKTLFFKLCFHFITQLLNFVVKYISIWKQTPTFITFPYIFCLETRELPHQNQFTWWIWFGICNPPWGNNAVRGT